MLSYSMSPPTNVSVNFPKLAFGTVWSALSAWLSEENREQQGKH